jgi:hypothetical protein
MSVEMNGGHAALIGGMPSISMFNTEEEAIAHRHTGCLKTIGIAYDE